MNETQMVKIQLPICDSITNITAETVWATPLKNGNYRIENEPAFHPEVCYGDIVKATWVDDFLTYERVVIRMSEH